MYLFMDLSGLLSGSKAKGEGRIIEYKKND
jgi:hypothetical protein